MLELKEFEKFEELQTPFWYYDLDLLRRTADEVAKYSRKYGIGVNYALKANVEPRILQIISSKGFGADCVSGNEVIYAVEWSTDSVRKLSFSPAWARPTEKSPARSIWGSDVSTSSR